MAELLAQGEQPEHHWCRPLPVDQPVTIGRESPGWEIPWDRWISARHVEATWTGGRLRVRKAFGATNPIFFRGKEDSTFEARPGESFVIGMTTLTVQSEEKRQDSDEPRNVQARTFRAADLERVTYRDAPRRMEVLSRLPAVIASAPDDAELFHQLVTLLLAGVARAGVVAVVSVDPEGGDEAAIQILRQDGRVSLESFRPSHHLIRDAIQRQRGTVLHQWDSSTPSQREAYTISHAFNWAYCSPIRGDACRGWGLYVAGQTTSNSPTVEINDDLKFTDLVASIVGALRQSQMLQRKHTLLSHFFSPAMMPILTAADPEAALRPRLTQVTVLFCDLRGFSRTVEAAGPDLVSLLERVSQALGLMTQNILSQRGVIADFQGDAAMGFWGWPQEQPDAASLAAHAALGIRHRFETLAATAGHPLAGFRAGIGIATGPAVAGQIGTAEQAKVTVFGPVVNLASRLEGMTKLLRVPILIDEPTAELIRHQVRPQDARIRRLARVMPFGLDTATMIFELLPPDSAEAVLSDEHLTQYETALDAFLAGDWTAAYERLHRVPPQDHGKDLLMGFILRHNHTPPPDWEGIIPMESKS